ncbi:MAG: hypothetical protein ACRDPY_09410 [Streptosporangiaceae bacterium]
MIFFQQSASADKGMTARDVKHGRYDTAAGAVLAAVFGGGALVAGAALLAHDGSGIQGFAGAGFPKALTHAVFAAWPMKSGPLRRPVRSRHRGLVDEYRILVVPAAAGKGVALFTDFTRLRLLSSKAFSSGMLELAYAPAGTGR